MKELSIEEKARRYDEAFEIIKAYYNRTQFSSISDSREEIKTIEKAFPELKESEDDRIRKAIKYGLDHVFTNNTTIFEVTKEQCLAWLEKQGEHANFLNKIQIGDKVTRNRDGVLVNLSQLNRVAKKDEKQSKNNMGISEATKQKLENNLNKALEKETPDSWNEFLEKQDEQKPAWSEEDEVMFRKAIITIDNVRMNTGSSEYYQGICNWLNSLKDRVQPKQEWSEEDDIWLNNLIYHFEIGLSIEHERVASWLKFLRDRVHPKSQWKPSDEQIEALESVTENCAYSEYQDCLKDLIEQLKKLKG